MERLDCRGLTSTPKHNAKDDMFYGAVDATDAAEIRFLVDAETLGWLERESARTGISLEKVASAMLRKACSETTALGAPGITG